MRNSLTYIFVQEISDMQGLIEELQSQLLLPDETQKDDFIEEGKA